MSETADATIDSFNAALVLSDGSVFFGHGMGKQTTTYGELCFNTGLTGYQETISDPSFADQLITFTFPHIGNVGTNEEDMEASKVFAKGIILRESITNPSNFRATSHLDQWLDKVGIPAITGIDTRALTRLTRIKGPQNAAICYGDLSTIEAVKKKLAKVPSMEGLELAQKVTSKAPFEWKEPIWGEEKPTSSTFHVVAINFGAKLNILRCLVSSGCKVTVVPADTSAQEIQALEPNGIFLSNGPGDPAATATYAVPVIQTLIEQNYPIFGICLGHQLLATALGCQTIKMHQGHRGANQPVQDLFTNKVEITSQNHGFVVDKAALPENVVITHQSLFDQTIEGIKATDKPVFSVQHHPEASPGPHDSQYLFDNFVNLMKKHKR